MGRPGRKVPPARRPTEEKFRVLEDLLARHPGRRPLIFTDDTATVYRVAEEFLLPAITHQTPVKKRHETLACFRSGEYPTIVLSGTGTPREYIQRLGRILRPVEGKRALLYEVVAGQTSEEGVRGRQKSEGIYHGGKGHQGRKRLDGRKDFGFKLLNGWRFHLECNGSARSAIPGGRGGVRGVRPEDHALERRQRARDGARRKPGL